MPKVGKKNHILGDFFFPRERKKRETGKEFGIEGKKEKNFLFTFLFSHLTKSADFKF